MLSTALQFLPLAAFLAALLFFVRLLCAPFSPRILKQMSRYRKLHFLWGCCAITAACFLYLAVHPSAWPPVWLERRAQRQELLERVNSAGGWAALKRDCDAFADARRDDSHPFIWYPGLDNNALPPAMLALKPRSIEFYPRKVLRQFGANGSQWFGSNVVVRLSVFGAHSTGGHDQPALGLDVLCESGVSSYSPEHLRSTTPLRYWHYRKLADNIYEFY
jgi:hypothetical protein